MGRIRKGVSCSVLNCKEEAVRSVDASKAKNAGLEVDTRRAYLCKEHYKACKKGNKKMDQINKWRHGVG
jgi:ribosomal protein L13E